jgi:hypothetical protein
LSLLALASLKTLSQQAKISITQLSQFENGVNGLRLSPADSRFRPDGFGQVPFSNALTVLGVLNICIANAAAARLNGLRPFFSVDSSGRSRLESGSSQIAFAASKASN